MINGIRRFACNIRSMTKEEHKQEAKKAIERVKESKPDLLTPEQWKILINSKSKK